LSIRCFFELPHLAAQEMPAASYQRI